MFGVDINQGKFSARMTQEVNLHGEVFIMQALFPAMPHRAIFIIKTGLLINSSTTEGSCFQRQSFEVTSIPVFNFPICLENDFKDFREISSREVSIPYVRHTSL